MCGIFGVVGHELADTALESVFNVLHHRGPDGRGLYVDGAARLTLAHTRLAVIDLLTGSQPLESEDGSLVLIANGEIYDFERIRSSLEAKGYQFRTKTDSEVILHLYREFGVDCLEQLRGEFAFLLYDKTKQLLIAARDRFGIKPLYFSRRGGGFVFASEMKAIFASGIITPKLNILAFDPFFDAGPGEAQFPFEGVEHVPPASYLLVDLETGESKMMSYWSAEIPDETAEPIAARDDEMETICAGTVLRDLEGAVRLRLRADVAVGLYLSGGIDSAFVGALMQRNLDSPFHSFSISFAGSDRDEQIFARRAADVVGSRHHELSVTKKMLWDNLEQCLWFSELPFVTLAPVGKYLLSQEARKFVTVVLTGEGADEVFLGYRTFFQNAISETRHGSGRHRHGSAKLRRLRLSGLGGTIARKLSLRLVHRSQRKLVDAARRQAAPEPNLQKPLINVVQEARIAGMPLDILCYLGDREEMAHSLEARLPFLDHQLYDDAKRIPVDLKMRGDLEKAVLRDAAKDILPEDLRLRKKSGFMVTSDAVDLFGADHQAANRFRIYLLKERFEEVQLFSYRAYLAASLLARLPAWSRGLKRIRRNSNKLIMYMLQGHMLHDMFIAAPRWEERDAGSLNAQPAEEADLALMP
jgi:asparagine synthase (glutamine-hydrolysing)